jgi:hypothetical protein
MDNGRRPTVSDQPLTTSDTRARHLFLGLLLGLGPLVLAIEGILAWGRFDEVGVALFLMLMAEGLTLAGVGALAVIPLLIKPATQRIGLGMAVGLVITSAVAVYLTTHGFWNGMFD